jgi:hypothetical protein
VNLQEFRDVAIRQLPDEPTRDEWADAVAFAESKLSEVDDADRQMARSMIAATLIEWGALWGFLQQETGPNDDTETRDRDPGRPG